VSLPGVPDPHVMRRTPNGLIPVRSAGGSVYDIMLSFGRTNVSRGIWLVAETINLCAGLEFTMNFFLVHCYHTPHKQLDLPLSPNNQPSACVSPAVLVPPHAEISPPMGRATLHEVSTARRVLSQNPLTTVRPSP
jgi:hypothetical protein